eukprot:TRINITY_DN53565_c0_g1_i1.p1 TRINITY_DN53565_c0_g1~~TRINITY_DN53565_c0_g1_i1.p1  ORF type:complete len:170 (+),score=2.43 TRINITY_DN53565_c0_g1_i1:55-564(+)
MESCSWFLVILTITFLAANSVAPTVVQPLSEPQTTLPTNTSTNSNIASPSTQTYINDEDVPDCVDLQPAQFVCQVPPLDSDTFELEGCTPDDIVSVTCTALVGVDCYGNTTFNKTIPCRYTNGYKLRTTLALSIFLGFFGVDRCCPALHSTKPQLVATGSTWATTAWDC